MELVDIKELREKYVKELDVWGDNKYYKCYWFNPSSKQIADDEVMKAYNREVRPFVNVLCDKVKLLLEIENILRQRQN